MPQIYQGKKARNQATHVLAIRNNPVEQNQWTSKPYNIIAAIGLVKTRLNEGSSFDKVIKTLTRRYHTFISTEPLRIEEFDSHITESDFISKITQLKLGGYMGLYVDLEDHAITLHILQDKEVTHFIYINLGGIVPSGVRVYSINPNELEVFAHTVYQAFSSHKSYISSARLIREFILNNKDKINSELSQALTMKQQKVGNCAMASSNTSMRLQYTANIMQSYDMDLQQAHNFVRPLYKEVMRQDRRAAFNFLLTHPEYFANKTAHAYDILQCLVKFDNKDTDEKHPTDYIKQIAQQGCWVHVLQQQPSEFSAYLNSYVCVQNDHTTQLYYIGDKLKKIKLINATKFTQELQKVVINLGATSFNLNGQEVANLINPHVATKDQYHPASELILNLLAKTSNKQTVATYYANNGLLPLDFFPYPKIMRKYYKDTITQQLCAVEKKIIHYTQSNDSYGTKIDNSFKILNILSYLLQQLKQKSYPKNQIYSNLIMLLVSSEWEGCMQNQRFINVMTEKFGQELLHLLQNTKATQAAIDKWAQKFQDTPLLKYRKDRLNRKLYAITKTIEQQKIEQIEDLLTDELTYLTQQKEQYSAERTYYNIAQRLFDHINELDELKLNFWQDNAEKILEILDNEHNKNIFIEKYLSLNYENFAQLESKNRDAKYFREELKHRMSYLISFIQHRVKFIHLPDTTEHETQTIKVEAAKPECHKPMQSKPEIQVTLPASPLNLSSLDEVCKYIQTYYPLHKLNGDPVSLFRLILTNVAEHLSGEIPSELMELLHELQQMEDLNYEHYVSCITSLNKYHKERKLVAEAIENEFGVLQILGKDDARKQSINQIKAEFIKFQTDNNSHAPVNNSFFQNPGYSKSHFTTLLAYGKLLPSDPSHFPHHHI